MMEPQSSAIVVELPVPYMVISEEPRTITTKGPQSQDQPMVWYVLGCGCFVATCPFWVCCNLLTITCNTCNSCNTSPKLECICPFQYRSSDYPCYRPFIYWTELDEESDEDYDCCGFIDRYQSGKFCACDCPCDCDCGDD